MTAPGWPFGQPLPAPIESDPSGLLGHDSVAGARAMLATAIEEMEAAGVQLGVYDRRILAWIGGRCDQPTVATIASLLHRATIADGQVRTP